MTSTILHPTEAEASLSIKCPTWCTLSAQDHADQLWNLEGECHHMPADVDIMCGVPSATREAPVGFVMTTSPVGNETAPPVFFLDGQEFSAEQFRTLAGAMLAMLDLHAATVTS